jgi:hypothetical protein
MMCVNGSRPSHYPNTFFDKQNAQLAAMLFMNVYARKSFGQAVDYGEWQWRKHDDPAGWIDAFPRPTPFQEAARHESLP